MATLNPASRRSVLTVVYVTNGTTDTREYTAARIRWQRIGVSGHARLYDERGRLVRRVSWAEAAEIDEEISYE